MSDKDSALARECLVFVVYLTGQTPSKYIVDRYLEAHRCGALSDDATSFERMLIGVARQNRLLARVADAYAGIFARRSPLRGKLVLLLALLETTAPTYRWIDGLPSNNGAVTLVKLCGHGVVSAICLVLGLLLFAPFHLFTPAKKAT